MLSANSTVSLRIPAMFWPPAAVYRSYWQTMRRGEDKRYAAGGFGTSEDHLVKIKGEWFIQHRKLVVFTE